MQGTHGKCVKVCMRQKPCDKNECMLIVISLQTFMKLVP